MIFKDPFHSRIPWKLLAMVMRSCSSVLWDEARASWQLYGDICNTDYLFFLYFSQVMLQNNSIHGNFLDTNFQGLQWVVILQSPASFKAVQPPIWPNSTENQLSIGFCKQMVLYLSILLKQQFSSGTNLPTLQFQTLPKKGFSEIQCKAE